MDAFVPVILVVVRQRRQDTKFNTRGVSIFLHGSDDFDGTLGLFLLVPGLDDFPKGALTEQF